MEDDSKRAMQALARVVRDPAAAITRRAMAAGAWNSAVADAFADADEALHTLVAESGAIVDARHFGGMLGAPMQLGASPLRSRRGCLR